MILLCGEGCYVGEVAPTVDGWYVCLSCGWLYTSTEAAMLPRRAGLDALDRIFRDLQSGKPVVAGLQPGEVLPFKVEPETETNESEM